MARAEAAGQRSLLSVEQAVAALGVAPGLPYVGYVFSAAWAQANRSAVAGFLDAGRRARAILLHDDAEWQRIRPLTGARGPAELDRLRALYRAGVPAELTPSQRDDAARLYDIVARIGGAALVGPSPHLAPGTFWTG